ncbi:alpha/beta hydrolase [Babesia caballi]|uniref:Alpha/beta hydrolase n=1 Tax=Babesia caballi TaxID=5871 RepID=A0AAV4LNY3_BABCB|nr:alpha/beta hydrolase [Babesia caballi]
MPTSLSFLIEDGRDIRWYGYLLSRSPARVFPTKLRQALVYFIVDVFDFWLSSVLVPYTFDLRQKCHIGWSHNLRVYFQDKLVVVTSPSSVPQGMHCQTNFRAFFDAEATAFNSPP